MIYKGNIITFKPEWRDPGDERRTFVARSDEELGRFDCSCLEEAHLPIWPQQTVTADQVEAITGHLGRGGIYRALSWHDLASVIDDTFVVFIRPVEIGDRTIPAGTYGQVWANDLNEIMEAVEISLDMDREDRVIVSVEGDPQSDALGDHMQWQQMNEAQWMALSPLAVKEV